MFLRIHVLQGPVFWGVQVQVLEVVLKLIIALNFSLLRHDIYVYNFFSLSINVKKYMHQIKLDCHPKVFILIMIFFFFFFRKVFQFVTQKISYCKIIYQSRKQCSFFYIRRKMCVNFLKYWIDIFTAKFIFIYVSRKRS